jgi:TolA-binding protein
MDPNKAPSMPSHSVEDHSSNVKLRRLWQVPVFFLGVAAVVAVCLTRSYVASDPVHQLHQELAETRRLLEGDANDPDGALRHAQQAVEDLSYDPGRAAEAFFLLGSAHLRVADGASESSANEHWREARRCFEEAERRGLDGEDGNRLRYRLAKLSYHLGEDPGQVVGQLKAALEGADDRAEALTLLSRAYLRLNPPNLKEALRANKKLREEVPQIGEDVLGPAKLAGAKLLLQLNQREEAQKTLEKISDRSAASVLAEKNMLLAGLYQEDHKWAEAAALWQAVLDDKRVPVTEAVGVLYNLGVCYRRMEQNGPAAKAWNDCMSRSQGEEAQAAALSLAELRLHEANPEKGVVLLAEAVAKIRKADDWKNSLMSLVNVRELFEQAMTIYRQSKQFDLAVRTAELYERVAAPPKAQLRRAELNSEWAKVVRERALSAKDEAKRKKEQTTADELLRQAAESHAEAAKLLTEKSACDEHLWLSAVCSYEGHDYTRAADKLREIIEREKENVDRLSEGLFLLGETCRNLHDAKDAETAYKKCVECGAGFTYRARYQLAMLEIEAGHIDSAEKELDQNILIEHRDTDAQAQEQSRLALCALQYQKAASLPSYYRKVVQHLEGHIDHFSSTPESVRARYQLADSYRQQVLHDTLHRNATTASEKLSPDASEHFLELNKTSWTRAAEEFSKLEELVKEPELASLLSNRQKVEIPFHVAECYFNLGEYEKALQKFEELAQKWGKTPYGLQALGWTVRCLGSMHDFERLNRRAEEVRVRFSETEGLSEGERKQWLDWLSQISKPVQTDPGGNSSNEQPKIINENRDGSRTDHQGGPMIESPQR